MLAALIIRTYRPDDGGSKYFETSVNYYQSTQRYIPEDSRHRENNLKCCLNNSVL
jgi:hypothetical protein